MTDMKALISVGLVVGAVVLNHAQTEGPRNLAGADFPCTYNKPITQKTTAKFLETINDVTFATGFEIQSGSMILRAESAMCQANGECALTGKVTVTLSAQQPAPK